MFQTKQMIKMEHSSQRNLIYLSYCDSLESVNPESFNSYHEEKIYRNPKGYQLQLLSDFFSWGYKGFLKIMISDPAGTDSFFVEIRKKRIVPNGTVLVYDNSNFGLALSDGSNVAGNILMLRPEIRDQKLNYNSKNKTSFSHHIYRMNSVIFNYKINQDLMSLPFQIDSEDSGKIFIRKIFEISGKRTVFDQSKEYRNCIFYVTAKTTFENYPNGFGNQIIFKSNTILKGKSEIPIDFFSLTDSLTIDYKSELSGNLFILNSNELQKNKLIMKKESRFTGNVFADGTLISDSNTIEGVLIANNIQVNLPPTTYAHYLINFQVLPNQENSQQEIYFPYFWLKGETELK